MDIEFLQKVWLSVYLKALTVGIDPEVAADRAVEAARKHLSGIWSVSEDTVFHDID